MPASLFVFLLAPRRARFRALNSAAQLDRTSVPSGQCLSMPPFILYIFLCCSSQSRHARFPFLLSRRRCRDRCNAPAAAVLMDGAKNGKTYDLTPASLAAGRAKWRRQTRQTDGKCLRGGDISAHCQSITSDTARRPIKNHSMGARSIQWAAAAAADARIKLAH